jgi:radical SAM superfamily enzyme YgiQ (UPF0313 family)
MLKGHVLLLSPSHFIGGKNITYKNVVAPEYAPLNLAYLAGTLESNNFRVRIIDVNIEESVDTILEDYINEKKPIIVGISTTTPLFGKALELAEQIKGFNPEVPIVFGGTHPTVLPLETIKNKNIDFAAVGEGEITLLELCDMLHEGRQDFDKINGLVYKKNGEVIKNPPRIQIKDLDGLAFPRRDMIQSHKYKYPDTLHHKTLPIVTSRGCPGLCTFCSARKIFPHVRFRQAGDVVDEMEMLIKQYGVKEIHIWDDCFTLHKKRVFEIQVLMEKRKIDIKIAFPNGVRVDAVDDEIFCALKKMGVYSIAFGVESGNQEILDRVQKEITLEQVEEAFRLAKKYGFETWGFFMLGFPGEDEGKIQDTIDFAKKVDPDIAKFSILMPFPNTEVYSELDKEGLILDKNFFNYGYHSRPVHRLPTLTPEDFIRLHSKAYRAFYLRPRKILQQILRLKTWERVKTNVRTGFSIMKVMFKDKR